MNSSGNCATFVSFLLGGGASVLSIVLYVLCSYCFSVWSIVILFLTGDSDKLVLLIVLLDYYFLLAGDLVISSQIDLK